ncbi:MAG: DUF481 domain-containing protein [Candidatus Binatia bacterium]
MFRRAGEGNAGGVAAVVCAALLCATAARADQVTSKGTVLTGKVTALSSSGLTFEPEYGKGTITIDWKNVEDIKTDGPMQVLYGDGLEADAPLQGFSDGKLLVGGAAATATAVPTADLHSAVPLGADGLTWQDRMRSYWRYWDGSADFGLNYQQATTETLGFLLGAQTTRKNGPTRFSFAANYRYSTQKKRDEKSTAIEDRLFGGLRGEYDLTDRIYAFAAGDATYDAIQKLSIRGVPKGGLGYTIWEEKLDDDKRNFLSGEAGAAWVYEKYFESTCTNGGVPIPGCDTQNDYFSIAFGAAAGYHLPFGSHIGWKMDYLPAVDNWATDFLLRNAIDLTMPLMDPVSAKLGFLNEYNNSPARGTNRTSLFLTFGLSVGW